MITTTNVQIANIDVEVLNSVIEKISEISDNVQRLLVEKNNPKQKFLTKKEVAVIFKVDPRTVTNWTEQGLMKSYYMGGIIVYKESEVYEAPIQMKPQSKRKFNSNNN